ncbi:MAG TPA: histidine phosphatase family protein [Jatrophihabitantaceae bacterium]|jgi:broad specificity phosphatase PhoE|nr:histidine phosphatase family protein [Jatrophihabitantaceae bacterium]
MRVVHLVRHGEVYNPDAVLYGRLPGFGLSQRGIEQAELAARFLAERDIGYIVSSPLERAQQTAQPLARKLGLPVAIDERLIEAGNYLEGKQVVDAQGLLTDPSNWKYLRNPLRPSWGEPYLEIAQRVLAATRDARDAADGHDAVCVSHQLPIWVARRYVEGKRLFHDPRRRQCALGSVTSFTFVGDVVVRVDYVEPAGSTSGVAGA